MWFNSSLLGRRNITPIQGRKVDSSNPKFYKNMMVQLLFKTLLIFACNQKKNQWNSQLLMPTIFLIKMQFVRANSATLRCSYVLWRGKRRICDGGRARVGIRGAKRETKTGQDGRVYFYKLNNKQSPSQLGRDVPGLLRAGKKTPRQGKQWSRLSRSVSTGNKAMR